MGRVGGVYGQESRDDGAVIKIKHSAERHSTGKLTNTTCSTTINMTYLGAHWEKS